MKPSQALGERLSLQRRYAALILLLLFLVVGFSFGLTVGDLGVKFIQGGCDNVIARWSSPANSYEAIGGFIGITFGFALGYWTWKLAMLRTGFLTPSQLDALNKRDG